VNLIPLLGDLHNITHRESIVVTATISQASTVTVSARTFLQTNVLITFYTAQQSTQSGSSGSKQTPVSSSKNLGIFTGHFIELVVMSVALSVVVGLLVGMSYRYRAKLGQLFDYARYGRKPTAETGHSSVQAFEGRE